MLNDVAHITKSELLLLLLLNESDGIANFMELADTKES